MSAEKGKDRFQKAHDLAHAEMQKSNTNSNLSLDISKLSTAITVK